MLQLSLMFALLFLLMGRPEWALIAAAVGSLSLPSLPLVAVAIVLAWIVIEWWRESPRSLSSLVRPILPALAVDLVLAIILLMAFGWAPLLATLLPLRGGELYRALNWGIFADGWNYLHPPGCAFLLITWALKWVGGLFPARCWAVWLLFRA